MNINEEIDKILDLFERNEVSDNAEDLMLYIDNDRDLYRQRKMPIYKNLSKKMKKSYYDSRLAAKAFMYLVQAGAEKYTKELGEPGTPWHKKFTKRDREELAFHYAKQFEIDFKNKEHDFMKESEEDLFEDVIDDLKDIVKTKSFKKVKFQDKSSVKVDLFSASALVAVFNALNPDNQKKFRDLINKNKAGLMKLHDFAFKHLK